MNVTKIVRGRKFEQVLEGARKIFMEEGFEGASVDAIAREAGVSKATLYSYFSEKRLMLLEVARVEYHRQAEAAELLIGLDTPVEHALPMLARLIAEHLVSRFGVQLFRLSVGETERFPELAREYYESGPEMLRARLVDYLRRATARGELEISDFGLAAEQFSHLCAAYIHDKAIFGMGEQLTSELMDRTIDGAVGVFLAAYRRTEAV